MDENAKQPYYWNNKALLSYYYISTLITQVSSFLGTQVSSFLGSRYESDISRVWGSW